MSDRSASGGRGPEQPRPGNEPGNEMAEAARRLRERVQALRFPLDAAGAADARTDAAAIVQQLDDYVLPRVENLDAPALVVVGGSTGSGKSLLVSSIVGRVVSPSGVIRPTTRSPVLVHHPDSENWFGEQRILPGMARIREHRKEGEHEVTTADDRGADDPRRELRLVASDAIPQGIALLDAPDIDSIDAVNRDLAAQLLAAADVWVFVTTAARYSDAVPWSFLTKARERGAPLVMVLNRVPPGAEDEIRTDLDRLLTTHGLPNTQIFTITEQQLADTKLIANDAAPLRSWLVELGSNHEQRAETVRKSLRGVFSDIQRRSLVLADAADAQSTLANGLREDAEQHYHDALSTVRREIADGTLIRGEVLTRWEEFVGTGELLRQLRTGIGRLRTKIGSVLTGRPVSREQLDGAVEHVLQSLIVGQSDDAAARTMDAWKASAVGTSIKNSMPTELARSSSGFGAKVEATLREWQGGLIDLVRDKGASRRTTARVLSLGVNGLSAVLMMLVFSHTGGLTGGEVAVAGGASAMGHALLEALLGDENLRRMANGAREDLLGRVDTLFDEEAARYHAALDDLGVSAVGGSELRVALQSLDREL